MSVCLSHNPPIKRKSYIFGSHEGWSFKIGWLHDLNLNSFLSPRQLLVHVFLAVASTKAFHLSVLLTAAAVLPDSPPWVSSLFCNSAASPLSQTPRLLQILILFWTKTLKPTWPHVATGSGLIISQSGLVCQKRPSWKVDMAILRFLMWFRI